MNISTTTPSFLCKLLLITSALTPFVTSAAPSSDHKDKSPAIPTQSVGPAQATITDYFTYDVLDGSDFSCARDNRVPIKLERLWSRDTWWSRVTCGIVKLNGRPVTIEEGETSYPPSDLFYVWYHSPVNRILMKLKYANDYAFEASISSARLVDADGVQLNIQSEAIVRYQADRQCPGNMAIIAFFHSYYICGSIWQGNPPPTGPGGVISFREGESDQPCALPVPNGPLKQVDTYMLPAKDSPCADNVASSIELENVPSATRIVLSDAASCEKSTKEEDSLFWIEILTTQKSTTMSKFNIDEFFGFSPGAFVRPGVKLVNFGRFGSAYANKQLSCVQITTSSAPPSA